MQGKPGCLAPPGNRPLAAYPADASRARHAVPPGPHQMAVSPTVIMMQRARAARAHMPVYNSPPLLLSAADTSRGLLSAYDASALHGGSTPNGIAPTAPVQASSPSVIWVGPSGKLTPSEAPASPFASAAAAAPRALRQSAEAWPQLRGSLEASLVARAGVVDEQVTQGGEQWQPTRSKLEAEIALMQVRAV
jgi:hypothetical protein